MRPRGVARADAPDELARGFVLVDEAMVGVGGEDVARDRARGDSSDCPAWPIGPAGNWRRNEPSAENSKIPPRAASSTYTSPDSSTAIPTGLDSCPSPNSPR
jgi:hypothetical protein